MRHKLGGLGEKERRKIRILLSNRADMNGHDYKYEVTSLNVAYGGRIREGKRGKYCNVLVNGELTVD